MSDPIAPDQIADAPTMPGVEWNRQMAQEFAEGLALVYAGAGVLTRVADLVVPALLDLDLDEFRRRYVVNPLRVPIDDRRQAVEMLTGQGWSTRQIASVLGVSHVTVARDQARLAPPAVTGVTAEEPDEGEGQEAQDAPAVTGVTAGEQPEDYEDEVEDSESENDDEPEERRNPQLYSSDSIEWYTPPDILARVERTLGAIDLDPCSNDGVPNVPARIHYTVADDGLSHPWGGRVFMNPPYGRVIAEWVAKLVTAYSEGTVDAAIALVPARTDTEWFSQFRDSAVCFLRGRLTFSEHENPAPFPSCAIYLGGDVAAFALAFADVGDVWTRWERF